MDIHKFSISEMYSNSQGKTSASLVAAHVMIATGCVMGIIGAIDKEGNTMLQGIAFGTLGATLLGIRRVTADKAIPDSADPITITETKTQTKETKIE
jgi:hypothetical protein